MVVDETEKEDFQNAISKQGFDISDFELEEQEYPTQGATVQPITGRVTIRRKSTGIKRTYAAGHDTSWPADFTDELCNGLFG